MQLSLEQMSILVHARGITRSDVSCLAIKTFSSPSFDEAVARKTIDHMLQIGLLRKEEGLVFVSRAGKKALLESIQILSRVASEVHKAQFELHTF